MINCVGCAIELTSTPTNLGIIMGVHNISQPILLDIQSQCCKLHNSYWIKVIMHLKDFQLRGRWSIYQGGITSVTFLYLCWLHTFLLCGDVYFGPYCRVAHGKSH